MILEDLMADNGSFAVSFSAVYSLVLPPNSDAKPRELSAGNTEDSRSRLRMDTTYLRILILFAGPI